MNPFKPQRSISLGDSPSLLILPQWNEKQERKNTHEDVPAVCREAKWKKTVFVGTRSGTRGRE